MWGMNVEVLTNIALIATGIWLCILAVIDIRTQRIPIIYLVIMEILQSLYFTYMFIMIDEVVLHIEGITLGVIFLILSKITDEKLGYGDSIVMLLLAVYLGWWHLLTVMIWTFTASYIYIIINLLRKKLQKGDSLPFLPFLSIGYVGYVIGDFLL